ncbi:GNAT family acetyltransferase [Pedobacter lusitanus]|uniref:GNAT family acetyltransferase n=1 Tax=Pedobacter lusitanus TaxID=1503925 RepID=A0A0D0F784_9SPHI|nr:GNAT family N-acetyltransferase [Pedobacter lusitanus]KIO77493.1 GNAT family acetyltransferase [Pedobacter lusitanus]
MNIEQFNDEKKGSFKAIENDKVAGEMTYVWAGPGKIIIDHTEVNPDFSGKGVGKKLVLEAVKYARDNKVKILPLCPFAKSVFDKNPDLQDVLF